MGVSGQKTRKRPLVGSGSPRTEELEQPADGSSNLPRATICQGRRYRPDPSRKRAGWYSASSLGELTGSPLKSLGLSASSEITSTFCLGMTEYNGVDWLLIRVMSNMSRARLHANNLTIVQA